jgi:hypothetical protein
VHFDDYSWGAAYKLFTFNLTEMATKRALAAEAMFGFIVLTEISLFETLCLWAMFEDHILILDVEVQQFKYDIIYVIWALC